MRPGLGHLLFGLVLLAAGAAVTVLSEQVVWYGAIVVGVIEVLRGIVLLVRTRRRS